MKSSKAILGALVALVATVAQAQSQPPAPQPAPPPPPAYQPPPPPPGYAPPPPEYRPMPTRPPPGYAGDYGYGVPPGYHTHDGFYLRLDLGVGYEEQKTDGLKVSGAAGEFGVAVGGAVVDNFIIAAHLFVLSINEPKVEMNGVSGTATDSSAGLVGFGPQLTYYFMPANVYLSGTLAFTRLAFHTNGSDANSEWGGGLQLAVGKEWWVSDNWGLGVAGQFFGSSNKDQGTNAPTLTTWGAAVVFSATYN